MGNALKDDELDSQINDKKVDTMSGESQIYKDPLPLNFYRAEGWMDSILKYYADERQHLPRQVLKAPMDMVTSSIQYAIDYYGNFPDTTYKLLRQVVNPLWEKGEYLEKVYKTMIPDEIPAGKEAEYDDQLRTFAAKLYDVRKIFEKDEEFLKANFSNEIEQLKGDTFEEKMEHFEEAVKMITKIHVVQVAKMIMARRPN